MSSREDKPASSARLTPQRGWRPDQRDHRPGAARRARQFKIAAVSTVLAVLVGVTVWLMSLRDISPVRFVGIGIGPYLYLPPNAGGQADVAELRRLFQSWHDQYGAVFLPDPGLDDSLSGVLPTRLREKLGSSDNGTLVVYCAAHGFLDPEGDRATVQLFGIDADINAVQASRSDQVIPFRKILDELQHARAKRVVLCINLGQLDPDWRLGILAPDCVEQLSSEVDSVDLTNVPVLISSDVNSTSLDKSGAVRSVFGRAIESALQGNCDDAGPSGARDGVLKMKEFVDYVTTYVDDWSSHHRGASQSVKWLGDKADFELLAVRARPAAPDADPKTQPPPEQTTAAATSS